MDDRIGGLAGRRLETFGRRKMMPRACVADSKRHLRAFMSEVLEDFGFVTSECASAGELQAVLATNLPDLILLGIAADGIEPGQFLEILVREAFDGKVLEILKREGEAQRPTDGEPAVLFADLRGLRVRAEIDERHARGIKVGQEARVFGRGLRQAVFPGKVVAVREIMGKKTVFARTATERKDLVALGVEQELRVRPKGIRADGEDRIPRWLRAGAVARGCAPAARQSGTAW